MSRAKEENSIKLKYWSQIIHECKNSGMMTYDWLAQNGISRDAYYYWFRKVKRSAIDSVSKTPAISEYSPEDTTFVELPVFKHSSSPNTLLTDNNHDVASATISLGALTIAISDNASSDFLLKLVGALSHAE